MMGLSFRTLLLAVAALVEGIVLFAGAIELYARHREADAAVIVTPDRPELKYVLRPSRKEVNAWGYREADGAPSRAPGTLRVAALGDSVTYGLLVEQEQAWPHVLEADLRDRFPVQVLDFGVPAYDIEQIAAMVPVVEAGWQPDVFVYGMFWNDPSPTLVTRMGAFPTWVGTSPRPFRLFGGGTDAALRGRSAGFRLLEGAVAARYHPAKEEPNDWAFFETWATVLLDRVAATGRPLLVLVIPPHVTGGPRRTCDHRAAQYAGFCAEGRDAVARARAWFEARGVRVADGLEAYRAATPTGFFADPRNPSHPNAEGHRRLAAQVAPLVAQALEALDHG